MRTLEERIANFKAWRAGNLKGLDDHEFALSDTIALAQLFVDCGSMMKLAEAQAREAELRAALTQASLTLSNLRPTMTLKSDGWDSLEVAHNTMARALALPADNTALREFGMKVADEDAEVVDAVLRGER